MPRYARPIAVALLALLLAGPAAAQGKSGKAKGHDGHGKKPKVTTDHAVVQTREVLVARGYEVVRVENDGPVRAVYYRRGNNGRGRGKGPVEVMYIRPSNDVVVIERAPSGVSVDINVRLGL